MRRPSRPQAQSERSPAPPSLRPSAERSARRPFARRWRAILRVILLLALLPTGLLLLYRFLPPPGTPLMLLRLAEGEGLDRRWTDLDDMAPSLAQAVIAAEDNRFCEHGGFDWPALRGELQRAIEGEQARGASTISMQTVKNLFLWPGRDPVRKVLEAWLTPQLELLWSKRRIIEVYLNIAETGPGIYGAEAAAQAYFGKQARELSRREAALIAAVLPNPRRWSPAEPTAYIASRARTIERRIGQLGPRLDCAR